MVKCLTRVVSTARASWYDQGLIAIQENKRIHVSEQL